MVGADVASSRWVQGLQGSTQKITDGINAVTMSPGQRAASQKAVWLQNVTASQDRWASAVGRVSTESWKAAAIGKGVPRIGAGAAAAQDKMQRVFAKLLPAVDSAVKSLPPRGNFEQNVQRSVALMQKLHAQAGQFSA